MAAAKITKKANSNVNYGTGVYGGKYMGSNTSSAYSNAKMDNAPGSTGYEKGSVTLQKKDDYGNVISQRTVEGVLPLGTSFKATGSALADAQNVPDSSGVFAYAKGRTPGYVEHVSGYSGYGYQDAKGNFYDANGNYLREDGYFYEPGASVSKNGMYQNTGSDYGNAKYATTYIPGFGTMYTKGSSYGAAPNSVLAIIDEAHGWSSGGSGGLTAGNNAGNAAPKPSAPSVEEEVKDILNGNATYLNNYFSYNNLADAVEKIYEDEKRKSAQNMMYRNY